MQQIEHGCCLFLEFLPEQLFNGSLINADM